MPRLTLYPQGRILEVRPGETVADTLARRGIVLEMPCGGEGTCRQCRLLVLEDGTWTARLGCQLVPEGDLSVRLLSGLEEEVPPGGRTQVSEGAGGATRLGAAIDLGTTTLWVSVVDLDTGGVLATASRFNPQLRHGHDVMSRISFGSTLEGLVALASLVREALNELLELLCTRIGAAPEAVAELVVAGNTTMLQLLMEVDPTPLGHAPFAASIGGHRAHPAGALGLRAHPEAEVYLPPVAHAFFGADLSAGLATTTGDHGTDRSPGFFATEGRRLFLDLGTNGELALAAGERVVFCSTAAGPAFEGMGLSCGRRATPGAIDAVHVDGNGLVVSTIEDAPVSGVCGSGVVDLVAALLRLGVLDSTGRMRRPHRSGDLPRAVAERLVVIGRQPAFRLGEGVHLTQQDVRQVQLAKAAVRAGIEVVCDATGTRSTDLDEVVIAGAFGQSLSPLGLEALGMVPPGLAERVRLAGNTSLHGAVRLLIDPGLRPWIARRIGRMEHVPLGGRVEFEEQFLCQIHFPR